MYVWCAGVKICSCLIFTQMVGGPGSPPKTPESMIQEILEILRAQGKMRSRTDEAFKFI